MTEKELRKLKRSDFLQLLLTQGKDMSAVKARLDEATEELEQLRDDNASLKAKLDEKDEQIGKLIGSLDDKERTISTLRQEIEDTKANRQIELEQAGSIAMAALSLNGIFEAAQKAADQYLFNIHLMHDDVETEGQPDQPEQTEKPEQTEQPESTEQEHSEEASKQTAEPAEQEHLEEARQTAKPASQPEEAPQALNNEPLNETEASMPNPETEAPMPNPETETSTSNPETEASTPNPETDWTIQPAQKIGLFEKLRLLGAR